MKTYTITASDQVTQAVIIPDRGACVYSLVLPFQSGAREILFQHDYAFEEKLHDLPGGLPFLFPICGRIARNNQMGCYLYDGKQYHLDIHGFSWREKWTVENVTDQSIEMVLRDNEETLAVYPFQFELRLRYEVLPGKILCHLTVVNCESKRVMPYYAGFHPYFLISGEKQSVSIHFSPIKRLQYNDTLTDIIGEQPVLTMPSMITNPAINEQLSVLSDDKLATLTFPNGDLIKINVTKHADYFPYLQLYTMPEKPFFCVEHWMAFPNALNTVSGARYLRPNEMEQATYEIGV